MKSIYLFTAFIAIILSNLSIHANHQLGDTSLRHVGFRITDASNKSQQIDRSELLFHLIIKDQKTPLSIHFYHDEHGNRDNQIASLKIPQIEADSGANVYLEFTSSKGCCRYDVTEITYSRGNQLLFKDFYHLEFYQFTSFKQYKKSTHDNYRWQSLNQFSKKNMPRYVLAKWMPTSERWTRYEVPFIEEN